MSLTTWLDKSVKRFKWYDISIVKLTVFFATLFLVAVWPAFHDLVMSIAWYWYLIIAIILMIPILKKMFA